MTKPQHCKPSFYAFCFDHIKVIARSYGYNMVLHGSMNRDLDMIAIPWDKNPGNVQAMLAEICSFVGGDIMPERDEDRMEFAKTHHGRMIYVVNVNRGGKWNGYNDEQYYFDISVMPATLC